jgi:hypothetical protein
MIAEFLEQIRIDVRSVESIDRSALLRLAEQFSVLRISGLIASESVLAAKTRLRNIFDPSKDNPATGEDPALLFANFQKFSVGGGELRDRDMPKCLRTFYNPIWAEDVFGMRECFRIAARLRNLVMGLPLEFAVDGIEQGFWTAARIHQYPAGGGFMGAHCEDYVPKILADFGIDSYYQPLVVMSKKGSGNDCDFERGGGFFEIDGERYYYEELCEPGEVLIYDTRVVHGVSEIDPHKPFRQNLATGRFAGLVTMYRDLTGGASVRKGAARAEDDETRTAWSS